MAKLRKRKTRKMVPKEQIAKRAFHHTSDEELAKALKVSDGYQKGAAQMIGLTQSAVCQRIKKSKYLQEVVAECRAEFVNFCETSLKKKIKGGDTIATIYALKSQGHHSSTFEKWDDKPSEASVDMGAVTINIVVDQRP